MVVARRRRTSRRRVKVGGRASRNKRRRRRRRRGPVATKGFRPSRVAGGRQLQLLLIANDKIYNNYCLYMPATCRSAETKTFLSYNIHDNWVHYIVVVAVNVYEYEYMSTCFWF